MIFSLIPISSSNKKRDVKVGFWWCWGLGCETFPVLDVFVITFLDLIWDVEALSQWQSPPTIYVYGYSDLELDSQFLPKNRDVMKTSCWNQIAIPDFQCKMGGLGGKCRYIHHTRTLTLRGCLKKCKDSLSKHKHKKITKKRRKNEIDLRFYSTCRGKCWWILIGIFKTRISTYSSLKNSVRWKPGETSPIFFGWRCEKTLVV